MCGICGVWGEGRDVVRAMVGAMHHRGPDDRGLLEDRNVSLGMTRLAILDVSHAGHQPMSSPDHQIRTVYTRELYHFREERTHRAQLGYTFRPRSDTAVLLRMYE